MRFPSWVTETPDGYVQHADPSDGFVRIGRRPAQNDAWAAVRTLSRDSLQETGVGQNLPRYSRKIWGAALIRAVVHRGLLHGREQNRIRRIRGFMPNGLPGSLPPHMASEHMQGRRSTRNTGPLLGLGQSRPGTIRNAALTPTDLRSTPRGNLTCLPIRCLCAAARLR